MIEMMKQSIVGIYLSLFGQDSKSQEIVKLDAKMISKLYCSANVWERHFVSSLILQLKHDYGV